jgi:hypothetical protein
MHFAFARADKMPDKGTSATGQRPTERERKMTNEQKKTKILAAAATHGWHADLYWQEACELRTQGIIEMRQTFTKVGARVNRWFLKAKEA